MARFQITDCVALRAPGRLIRQIQKLMAGVMDERLRNEPVNYNQWAALKMIHEGLAPTAGDLAVQLGHTSGATTRLIDSLESVGLIRRDRGSADRRVVRLSVTATGLEMMHAIMPTVVEAWNEMLVDFDQAEADQLVASLVKLLATIEGRVTRAGYAEAAE